MGRAPCCEKVGLKKGRWTADEDQILKSYIQTHGEGSWRSLPKNAGLLRCGKSCRLRWINYLRSDLKRGNITTEEEETIVKLHATMGNRWSSIAGHLPGRTDNEIKNYWNTHLSRKVYVFNKSGVKPIIADPAATKRRGRGRTSRATMNKKKESLLSAANNTNNNSAVQKDNNNVMHEDNANNIVGMGPVAPSSTAYDDYMSQELTLLCDDIYGGGTGSTTTSSEMLDWGWDWDWDPNFMWEDDYEQLWMDLDLEQEQDGGGASEKEQLTCYSGKNFEKEAEAMVAWLMS